MFLFKNKRNVNNNSQFRAGFFKSRPGSGGFTLIEMMVSVALFAIVMLVSMGAIITIIDSNRKARSLTEIMNNLNFSLESMTRTIKTGINPRLSGEVLTVEAVDVSTADEFDRVDTSYRLSGGAIQKRVGTNGNWVNITSDNVDILDLNFTLSGVSVNDKKQPKVLVLLKGEAKVTPKITSSFTIQTTISQRRLDLENPSN